MKITFQISAIPVENGGYQPKITLVESTNAERDFTGFVIHETFLNKETALKRARAHAIDEAHKQYGNDIEINIESDK